MIANETTEINNYRSPYGLQQFACQSIFSMNTI